MEHRRRKRCIQRKASVLLAMIFLVPLSMLRARQTKREHFVVSGSLDFLVTGSPIESAVHDCRPIEYCASTLEAPEDVSGARLQRVHLSCIRARIHDPVCNTYGASVDRACSGICCLPKDLSSGDIKCAPGSPRNLLS